MPKSHTAVTSADVQKTLQNTPPPLPSFYVCPYADPKPGQPDDYSLTVYPDPSYDCDINLAFFTPNDDSAAKKFGNTISDTFLCHLRDRVAIQQFIAHMKTFGRRIFVSYIDSPTIHWDSINIENFVRNTEGEFTDDGLLLTNDLMDIYEPVGRMWDAETPSGLAMAEVMKACFLRGIQRDPDHYVFIYTSYADRDIDQQILTMLIDPTKGLVDTALYELGFRRISDFITMRGSLSFLETMSYSGDPIARFQEADNYAIKYLAQGDASKLNEMRKFISIGVAPEITAQPDALVIAKACDPTQATGYGRFMVWAANSPEGLKLFQSMYSARLGQSPVPISDTDVSDATLLSPSKQLLAPLGSSGNRSRFFNELATEPTQKTPAPPAQKEEPGWIHSLSFGLLG